MESVSLIDVSSEKGLFLSSSSDALPVTLSPGKNDRLNCSNLETENMHQVDNSVKTGDGIIQSPELSASPKRKRMVFNKYNLRKSLAWDSAFFTDEGVLNQEELAIVNSTFGKAEPGILPSILEDMRKSAESSTTLDSDSWVLENLEVDLFDNLRASIQRSVGKGDKASTVAVSTKSTHPKDLDASNHQSNKKAEVPSHSKMKLPINGKRNITRKQLTADTSKADAGRRDVKPSTKPPRIASRDTLLPTKTFKQASAPGSIMKNESVKTLSGNALNQESLVVMKKSDEYKCIVSPSSSGAIGKSRLKTIRRKGDISNNSSDSTAHLRTSKGHIESRNLKSSLRFSSNVSPHSSVDSLASDSSSSTSIAKHYSTMGSPDTGSSSSSPSLKLSVTTDGIHPRELQKSPILHPTIKKEISGALPLSQQSAKLSSGSQRPADSSAGGSFVSRISINPGVKCAKPSGLRMPSPKIGYFDAEKSLMHNINRYSSHGPQNKFAKNTSGISNSSGASKIISSKILPSRPASESVLQNVGSPSSQPGRLSSIYSKKPSLIASSHQPSKPAEACGLQAMTTSKVERNSSCIATKYTHLKESDSQLGRASAALSVKLPSFNAEPATHTQLQYTFTVHSRDKPLIHGEGNSDLTSKDMKTSHQMAETGANGKFTNLYTEVCMKNDSHSAAGSLEKENLFPKDINNGTNISTEDLLERKVYCLSLSDTKDLNVDIPTGPSSVL